LLSPSMTSRLTTKVRIKASTAARQNHPAPDPFPRAADGLTGWQQGRVPPDGGLCARGLHLVERLAPKEGQVKPGGNGRKVNAGRINGCGARPGRYNRTVASALQLPVPNHCLEV